MQMHTLHVRSIDYSYMYYILNRYLNFGHWKPPTDSFRVKKYEINLYTDMLLFFILLYYV